MDELDHEIYTKLFGKRIKELRKKYAMSQSDLAGNAELEKTAIQRIERGYNSTLNTLRKLGKGFNISISELIELEE